MASIDNWDPTAHTDARPLREQRITVGAVDPGIEPWPEEDDAGDS